ncbi:hypothetical protein J4416_01850 [Candidatus Pacearchaeota archaeon]|nr:hypothetical protein [Candidatus Pacearchaeota archaeon]
MEKTGVAYGMFNSSANKEDIERELKAIQEYTQTDSKMELKLYGMDEFRKATKSPRELIDLLDKADVYPIFPSSRREEIGEPSPTLAKDLDYVLEASQKGIESRVVAESTRDILSGIYCLFEKENPFVKTIVYERDGSYWELPE